jgi:hypothetical protein
MQELRASGPPTFFLSLRARIALACFSFGVAALCMWDEFFRFDWVWFLCFGLYYLLYVPPMQKGESRKAYFSRPRAIICFVLLIAIMVSSLHSLHSIFTKYHF